ncbi:DUF6142 family protein [Eubacterium oxidoreducens]|uniref:Uncharacterized protein n=1 Tax=Eubacterium oxidoreducens TaxID=1732 RepID=A0A1G6BCS5_EUBOX|nr:DUF6142 family protein [Eubacterium oxidoreducens]SDB18430.1 hypothetical protein SAMN02910417_01379 [Eubacterium oxidoreducens]
MAERQRRHHRKEKLKFTTKKESFWGYGAIALDIAAVVVFLSALGLSVSASGDADTYLGSRGVGALLLSIAGVVIGMQGMRQKDVFKFIPKVGTIAGMVITLCLLVLYIVGILL